MKVNKLEAFLLSTILGSVFVLLFIIMGAMHLIVASLMLVSGLKAKAYSKNPVLLINGKKEYLASAIFYIVFMVLLLVSIYICLAFTFSLFIYLILLALLALFMVTIFKFLALKNLPNKENVLDVETLPDEKKEAILLKSNTLSKVDTPKKTTEPKKETEPKGRAMRAAKRGLMDGRPDDIMFLHKVNMYLMQLGILL